jgi:hypothetical protein
MLFAISGVTRYRAGLSKAHPYGYYLSAQAHLNPTLVIGGPSAIQNLLLIARFGMYHHIGVSLWEIGAFCMRQCIELGYHTVPSRPVNALKEQIERRIFWDCYILDRICSSTLGKPLHIVAF